MPISAHKKLEILNKVLKEGRSVSGVCTGAGIARKTFYQWKRRYLEAPNRTKKKALESRYTSGKNHPRNKRYELKDRLIQIVVRHPLWGSRKISAILCKLAFKLSNHAVYSLLRDLNLETKSKREEFSSLYQTFAKIKKAYAPEPLRLTPETRKRVVEEVEILGKSVSSVCKKYYIARKTFYKWLKRYREAREEEAVLLKAMEDNYVEGFAHPRSITQELQERILYIVKQHPEYSTHKVAQILAEVGNHGVQNVFARLDLNKYEKRLAYAKAYRPVTAPVTGILERIKPILGRIPKISAIPPPTLSVVIAKLSLATLRRRFASLVRPFFLALFSSVFLSSLFVFFLKTISQVPTASAQIGLFFASVALGMGSIFFAYSMKYYLTLGLVLSFSRQSEAEGGGYTMSLSGRVKGDNGSGDGNGPSGSGWLQRIFGLVSAGPPSYRSWWTAEGKGGLQPSLDHVKLKRFPFVSIHLPFYNEKKVVERLLDACTSMDYPSTRGSTGSPLRSGQVLPNYEIIVCDDSTDETTEIVQRYADRHNKAHPSGPKIKVLHRLTRAGFKGGALGEALEACDPRTEFVVVFDADFVPYPDTLELFVKNFQANGLDISNCKYQIANIHSKNQKEETNSDCRIAVIGGYQWHVLNKSENWITRGVRSEYAGSYVIERPGQELLGAMKLVSGSVYMIRADVLRQIGWGTSITEDFQLTLKLYEKGYKVVYTPYVQAPAECVSTLKRLIRQRMRWAEGHSNNIRRMFRRLIFGYWKTDDGEPAYGRGGQKTEKVWVKSPLTFVEKLEFLYLSPYYLQAAFFLIGTFSWLLAETVFRAKLPFWTSLWGWSLVLTNLLALPLMNAVGLFLEESEEKDYIGILSFVFLSYILVPFQAYAAVKGFLEKQEGPWFRTPKTGKITDIFTRGRFYRWISGILPGRVKPSLVPITTDQRRFRANPYFALATANSRFNQFKIRRRHLRWIGNLSVIGVSLMSIILLMMAPLIPLASAPVSAQTGGFRSLKKAIPSSQVKLEKEEIKSPVNVSYELSEGSLEYIFHPEPRVRVKWGNKEIETRVVDSEGWGNPLPEKAYKEGIIYTYQDVFEGVDLRYVANTERLKEEFVLNKYREFRSVETEVKLTGLVLAHVGEEIQIASQEGGEPLFYFQKPYLYEEKNPENKSQGIKYDIGKNQFGWRIKKVLTDEGKTWLADPSRVYPVVLDPTLVKSNVVASGMTDAETGYGSVERKITYSTTSKNASGNTDPAWYVVHANGGDVYYNRCSAATGCDADGDWNGNVEMDGDTGTDSMLRPNIYHQSDSRVWVVWAADSGTTSDALQFRYIDTTTTYPHTLGSLCNSGDQGTIGTAYYAWMAAGDNGDVVAGLHNINGSATVTNIWEIVPDSSCTSADFTSIEAGSGVDATMADLAIAAVAKGNVIHLIYEDNTSNDLRHSTYDVSDADTTWESTDNDVDGADNIDEAEKWSVATDGTDIWVLAVDGTTATDFFRCSNCPDSSPTWIQSDAIPWSGQSNVTEVSLTYISGTNRLAAFVMKDTTNEQVYTKDTNADSISWGTEYSLAYTAGSNGNLSSVMSVASENNIGVVILQGAVLRFSTVPENSLIFLILAPFLPKALKKLRKKRKRWKLV